MHKGGGLVRDVFRTRDMRHLVGNMGIAHCRYPTAGSASSFAEAQPLYVNSPFGIVLGPQRQPHQRRAIEARTLPARISATSTPIPIPKYC